MITAILKTVLSFPPCYYKRKNHPGLDAIFNSTHGHRHPDLVCCTSTLSLLQYECHCGHVEESQLLCNLVSSSYWSIQGSGELSGWHPDDYDETIRFLQKAFYEIDIKSTFSVDQHDPVQANISRKLKWSGLITETGDPSQWQFAAPLVCIIMGLCKRL